MSNPFDTDVRANFQRAGSFQASSAPAPRANKYQPLLDSVMNVADAEGMRSATESSESLQAKGAAMIATNEATIEDLQNNKTTTEAELLGAQVYKAETTSASFVNEVHDLLDTQEGAAMNVDEFQAHMIGMIDNTSTGSEAIDDRVKVQTANQMQQLSRAHAKAHRAYAENEKYIAGSTKLRTGMEQLGINYSKDLIDLDTYEGSVMQMYADVSSGMATDDQKRALFSQFAVVALQEDNRVVYDNLHKIFQEGDITLTDQQMNRIDAARSAYTNRATQALDDQRGMQDFLANPYASTDSDQQKHLHTIMQGVGLDIQDKLNKQIITPEQAETAALQVMAEWGARGIPYKQYTTSLEGNVLSPYVVGDDLSQGDSDRNTAKVAAHDDMTKVLEAFNGDMQMMSRMFSTEAMTEFREIQDKALYSTVPSAMEQTARDNARKENTALAMSDKYKSDSIDDLTSDVGTSWYQNPLYLASATKALGITNHSAFGQSGVLRDLNETETLDSQSYINGIAKRMVARNPALSPDDAVAQAKSQFLKDSLVMGEGQGVLFEDGKDITSLIGADNPQDARAVVLDRTESFLKANGIPVDAFDISYASSGSGGISLILNPSDTGLMYEPAVHEFSYNEIAVYLKDVYTKRQLADKKRLQEQPWTAIPSVSAAAF